MPKFPDASADISVLLPEVQARLQNFSKERTLAWGGNWTPTGPAPSALPLSTDYTNTTIVRSVDDALSAFEKYTEFSNYVLESHTRSSDAVVLLPCGAMKPIGASSIHTKKLEALSQAGYDNYDIAIVSEPCTIIPHTWRLTVPAINYDFPPEYTDPKTAPDVFEVFTDRLATWIDQSGYTRIYAYLVSGHMEKLDAAMKKINRSDVEVVKIPGASYNCETRQYSGDLFKSKDDISLKLNYIHAFNNGNPGASNLFSAPSHAHDFYVNRFGTSSASQN